MTPKAQRIAIAELQKWRQVLPIKDFSWGADADKNKCWMYLHQLPDYLRDLNAIAKAEQYAASNLMDADQWEDYGRALEKIHHSAVLLNKDGSIDYYDLATLITELTAAQRAEALLKTLNLWVC